jgi:hypothetical protein
MAIIINMEGGGVSRARMPPIAIASGKLRVRMKTKSWQRWSGMGKSGTTAARYRNWRATGFVRPFAATPRRSAGILPAVSGGILPPLLS